MGYKRKLVSLVLAGVCASCITDLVKTYSNKINRDNYSQTSEGQLLYDMAVKDQHDRKLIDGSGIFLICSGISLYYLKRREFRLIDEGDG